jgi:hypothetical protein
VEYVTCSIVTVVTFMDVNKLIDCQQSERRWQCVSVRLDWAWNCDLWLCIDMDIKRASVLRVFAQTRP